MRRKVVSLLPLLLVVVAVAVSMRCGTRRLEAHPPTFRPLHLDALVADGVRLSASKTELMDRLGDEVPADGRYMVGPAATVLKFDEQTGRIVELFGTELRYHGTRILDHSDLVEDVIQRLGKPSATKEWPGGVDLEYHYTLEQPAVQLAMTLYFAYTYRKSALTLRSVVVSIEPCKG